MSLELLTPQNAGNGGDIVVLPETTFDDDSTIRRLDDGGSLVGEAYFGARAILRLVELHKGSDDEITRLRLQHLTGQGDHQDYFQAEDLAGQN